jgi:hypothetical protein
MALVLLALLALSTFVAGVHAHAWRICVIGVVLGLALPAVAWVDQAAILLLTLHRGTVAGCFCLLACRSANWICIRVIGRREP